MKKDLFVSCIVVCMWIGNAASQGWQQIGPDSVNWRQVNKLTGRWLSPTKFHLAASTYNGIAIYEMQSNWNYTLTNLPGNIFHNGITYEILEFSPWEPDSSFIEYYIAFTELEAHILKWPFPPVGRPQERYAGALGYCFITPLSILFPTGSDSVMFGGICGVQRSNDRGSTWQVVSLEEPFGFTTLLATDRHSGNILYRARESFEDNVLMRSTNEGITWDSLFLLPSTPYEKGLIAEGDSILLSVRLWWNDTLNAKGIFRSTNAGASWTQVYNASGVADLVVSRVTLNTFYAAAEAGILKSTDFGQTWTIYNNGLPTTSVTSMIISPYSDTLYVSTETHGVLKVWAFITDVSDSGGFIPHEFVLTQNFPNPFNPSTTIHYQLPKEALVTLKVYNPLGQEVATLVSEDQEAGSYNVQFDGAGLASGVYFYRMRAGEFVETKKFVFLK